MKLARQLVALCLLLLPGLVPAMACMNAAARQSMAAQDCCGMATACSGMAIAPARACCPTRVHNGAHHVLFKTSGEASLSAGVHALPVSAPADPSLTATLPWRVWSPQGSPPTSPPASVRILKI